MKDYGKVRLPGELSKIWPRTAGGEFEKPVFLAHALSTNLEDEMLISMLRGYGIPALPIHPGDGDFGQLIMGASGNGTNIYVPESLFEDAKALMEAEPDELHE